MILNLASQVLFSNVCDLVVDKAGFKRKLGLLLLPSHQGRDTLNIFYDLFLINESVCLWH